LPLALVKVAPTNAGVTLIEFVGVSYVTFRSLDVIIGIEDRLITALSSRQYVLFLLFFPTVSSGPIDRFRRFAGDLAQPRTRQILLADVDSGVQHIMRGFAYKFLVAALIKSHWLEPAESAHGMWSTISYMYAYTAYLFFDFAGYSAFAIGVGSMLGIRTPENFRLPSWRGTSTTSGTGGISVSPPGSAITSSCGSCSRLPVASGFEAARSLRWLRSMSLSCSWDCGMAWRSAMSCTGCITPRCFPFTMLWSLAPEAR
jgi:hypothetical protein